MGKKIAEMAEHKGYEIAEIIDKGDKPNALASCDVAIDFSVPEAAFQNIKTALEYGIPVVSGTTGWTSRMAELAQLCKAKQGAFLYASNFSIGMNIFFEINRKLAQLMQNAEGYRVNLEEVHHSQKTDAPSGTAISLAEDIITYSTYKRWTLGQSGADYLPIAAVRKGDVPGTHTVSYTGEIDQLVIRHEAFSREGFAEGALIAAAWLIGKTGVFTMADVLAGKKV